MPRLHARLLHGTRSWGVTAALLLTLSAGHTQGAPFSIVLIPDTQNYYLDGAGFHADSVITCITDPVEHTTYECQMRWIATNQSRLNIRAAIHLGDMTNGNGANTPPAARAWAATSDAHRILDVAGVPYAVVPGNHDHLQVLLAGGHVLRRDTRWFDWFFPPSRFQQPWYVDSFPREPRANRNNAIRFTAGALKFVVISLDFAPEKDAVCWADSLARALTDHRIIVATHCYQGRSALQADSTRPGKYQPCAVAYHIVGMDGEDLWNEFVALHSNIVLAVSGHVQGGVGHTVRVSRARSTPVHEILVDYQEERYAGRKHGAGWMRVLEFDPTASLLRSHPISVLSVPAFNARTSSDACGTVALCYVNDPAHKDHTFETAFDVAHMAPDVHREPFGFADRFVNDRSDGDQNRSRIAMIPNGDFVATWQDDSEKPTGYYEIFGRAFRRDGCALVDGYRVNQNSHHQQREPDVAVDARGSTVVVWADDSRGTEGLYQVYARGLLRDGTQRFFPFTVNQVARGDQRTPRVAAARDGRFFVTWTDTRNDEGDIFVRGFDAGGHPLFSEVRVNEGDTNGLQDAPDIAVAGNGTLTVVWHSGDRIRARYFSPNGSTLGTLQSVATSAGVGAPAVAVAGDGHGAVTWRHGTHAIRAHQFTVGTDMSDGDIVVTNAGSGRVDLPAVDVASTGDFIVAWQDDADANNWWQIHSQAFTAGGAPRGAVQTVNKNSRGQQTEPSVAVAAGEEDGRGYTVRWVVSWTDDLDRNGKTQILARGGSYLAGAARKPGP